MGGKHKCKVSLIGGSYRIVSVGCGSSKPTKSALTKPTRSAKSKSTLSHKEPSNYSKKSVHTKTRTCGSKKTVTTTTTYTLRDGSRKIYKETVTSCA